MSEKVLKMKKWLLIPHILLLAYWIGTGYFRADPLFFAGLGVMGFSMVIREPGHESRRFGWLALLCIGLAFATPARSFHFLALVFSAFFVIEQYWGKINEAPAFTALLLTAGIKTLTTILGFPMRLQLSENAARALSALGSKAYAEGNLIHFEGQDFLVDPACAGLQMVEVSFLFCFFLLGLFERRTGRRLQWFTQTGFLLVTGVLILIFNQLRIIFLVVFGIPPEDPMHDIIGLAGLVLYVFAPLWWGIQWAFGKAEVLPIQAPRSIEAGKPVLPFLLVAFLLYFAIQESGPNEQGIGAEQAIVPSGLPADCRKETLHDGVIKYTNDRLLVYVKPVRGWYDTEHTPLICWQGSGYEFGQMQERTIGTTPIYTGILEKKGGIQYYTAWWFDNGRECTASQTRWRWLDMSGAPGFSLVNVTAQDLNTLETQIKTMLIH